MANNEDKRIVELPEIQPENVSPDTYFSVDSTPTSENPGNIDQTSKITYANLLALIKRDLTSTIDSEVSGGIDEFARGLIDKIYPVGSLYITTDNRNPNEIFGAGTWEKIKDKFILCSGDTYTAGVEGGAATVTLTGAQSGVKPHTHDFTQPTINSGGSATITGGSHKHGAPNMTDGTRRAMIGYNRQKVNKELGQMLVKSDSSSSSMVPRVSDKNTDWAVFWEVDASTHSHTLPDHTHTATGGAVSNAVATDATEPHNNMPPYLAVNVWKRVEDSTTQESEP